jgi:hypothetical protein
MPLLSADLSADKSTLARPLTPGETAMARRLFGDAIDYPRVRIYRRPYLWFGLQPRNCAMSPNGHIYFGAACCRDDFSCEPNQLKRWFMHEMVHVWQHQLGYPVKWRGALRIGLSYRYELTPEKKLAHFNMEAQGDLLADYFALQALGDPAVMAQKQYAGQLALYEQVLAGFLDDRSSRSQLPRFWRWKKFAATASS